MLVCVYLTEIYKILVMVIWDSLTVLIYKTAQNCVCVWISCAFNLPASVNKGVTVLTCGYGVKHN